MLHWIISSRQLCTKNIFNTSQTQDKIFSINFYQETLLSGYKKKKKKEMKSDSGEVCYPNMN